MTKSFVNPGLAKFATGCELDKQSFLSNWKQGECRKLLKQAVCGTSFIFSALFPTASLVFHPVVIADLKSHANHH